MSIWPAVHLGAYRNPDPLRDAPYNVPDLALWFDAQDASTMDLYGPYVRTWRDKVGNYLLGGSTDSGFEYPRLSTLRFGSRQSIRFGADGVTPAYFSSRTGSTRLGEISHNNPSRSLDMSNGVTLFTVHQLDGWFQQQNGGSLPWDDGNLISVNVHTSDGAPLYSQYSYEHVRAFQTGLADFVYTSDFRVLGTKAPGQDAGSTGVATYPNVSGSTPPTGGWLHVGVYDPAHAQGHPIEVFGFNQSTPIDYTTSTMVSFPNGNVDAIDIGASLTGVTPDYFMGHIGEILLFERVLSVGERTLIGGYLADHWGFTSNP